MLAPTSPVLHLANLRDTSFETPPIIIPPRFALDVLLCLPCIDVSTCYLDSSLLIMTVMIDASLLNTDFATRIYMNASSMYQLIWNRDLTDVITYCTSVLARSLNSHRFVQI
jgi:hypothetical protein